MGRDHAGDAAVYSHPRIYDLLHTPGTAAEVDGLERLAGVYGRAGGQGRPRARAARTSGVRSWLEPACGTGRYLRVLSARAKRRGERVRLVGVDLNGAMLEFARARIDGARFVRADMRRLRPGPLGGAFDAAFILQNSIRHLQSDADVVKHLAAVRSCLRPGGVYLVGTSLEPAAEFQECDDHYEARRGSLVVRDDVQYVPLPARAGRGDGHERVHSYVSVWRGRLSVPVAEVVSTYRLWCCSPRRWARLVAKAGLEQAAACDLDGTDLGLEHRGYAVRVLRRV
jgi:SAM-dependent methyltransferase